MNEDRAELIKLLEMKANLVAKRSLVSFCCKVKPDYDPNWHHILICNALEKLMRGDIKKLMIFIPPQHGKSTLSSIMFPAWALGVNPDLKVGVCSYSSTLASKFNRDTQLIMDDSKYINIFPETRLNSKNVSTVAYGSSLRNSEVFQVVKRGGYYKSVGVGGPLTGSPLDLGIIDDPFKDRIEAESSKIRENVWSWYTDVFLSRFSNNGRQLLLFTRWHEDDLAGRLLESEPDDWTVIKLPAIKEEEGDPSDPRETGEALWPERHSKDRILAQKKRSERTFASLYQQRPAPIEGGMIKKDWFNIIEPNEFFRLTKSATWDFYIDGAYTANTANDPSAILAGAIVRGNLYIREVLSGHIESADLPDWILRFARSNGLSRSSKIYVEPKASGHTVIQLLKRSKEKVNAIAYKFPYESKLTVNKDKIQKVSGVSPFIEGGRVYLLRGHWNDKFLEECAVFPNGTHDDKVDVLTFSSANAMFSGAKKGIKIYN